MPSPLSHCYLLSGESQSKPATSAVDDTSECDDLYSNLRDEECKISFITETVRAEAEESDKQEGNEIMYIHCGGSNGSSPTLEQKSLSGGGDGRESMIGRLLVDEASLMNLSNSPPSMLIHSSKVVAHGITIYDQTLPLQKSEALDDIVLTTMG